LSDVLFVVFFVFSFFCLGIFGGVLWWWGGGGGGGGGGGVRGGVVG